MAEDMKPKTKICKYCKSEIDAKAKICPHCRKKQKGKLLPIIIAIVVLIIIIGSCSAGGGNSDDSDKSTDTAKTETTQSTDDKTEAKEETEKETEKETKASYTSYKVSELEDDLDANAMKAKDKYCDQKIKITGYISNIDSDGAYIGINAGENDYSFVNIQCFVTSDKQKDVIMEKSTGDKVVIKGTCTDVGEILGYSIDIESIK